MSEINRLIRGLTLFDAISIVLGTIIGTGVFLKTATMAQLVGSPSYVLLAWVIGGLLSLTGALAYAELGSMMPDAGGEYVYLREGYGDLWAFLYGWMRFWIGSPGSIAAYAVGSMTFLSGVVDLTPVGGQTFAAIVCIFFFSLLNCLSVSFGGKVQSVMSSIKFLTLLLLGVGTFFLSNSGSWDHFSEKIVTTEVVGWSAFGSAILAALWAYDGWNNLTMVGGEIKDPKRNVPLSLIIGMALILIAYALVNLAFFYALPMSEIITANSSAHPDALPVATKAATTFLGSAGISILSAAFVFSSIGAMNGSILTSARVPYAMARDGLFIKSLGKVSPNTHVPVVSIIVQAGVASCLALSGTFDQLTDYVVFSAWIFYAMITGVVFKLRKTRPDAVREYKALGYPVLPAIFIILGVLLLFNTVITSPKSTAIGLTFILSGIPVFYFFKKSVTTNNSQS